MVSKRGFIIPMGATVAGFIILSPTFSSVLLNVWTKMKVIMIGTGIRSIAVWWKLAIRAEKLHPYLFSTACYETC